MRYNSVLIRWLKLIHLVLLTTRRTSKNSKLNLRSICVQHFFSIRRKEDTAGTWAEQDWTCCLSTAPNQSSMCQWWLVMTSDDSMEKEKQRFGQSPDLQDIRVKSPGPKSRATVSQSQSDPLSIAKLSKLLQRLSRPDQLLVLYKAQEVETSRNVLHLTKTWHTIRGTAHIRTLFRI